MLHMMAAVAAYKNLSEEELAEAASLAQQIRECSNPELTKLYLQVRREYRDLVKRTTRISRGSGGIASTGNRMFWASVLFTRISVMSKSVSQLLPDPKPREHWDFSSVASLTRNLQEAVLVYHWLCGPGVDEVERDARFILLQLHDHGSRRRLYPDDFPTIEEDPVFQDLKSKFSNNAFLSALGEKEQRVVLRGEKTPFIQDDVLREIGIDPERFRHQYRFFSQHTHTGPVSFYRMLDHGRGTGVETRMEKRYMIIAVGVAYEALNIAIDVHLDIFPDAETRTPHLTEQQIIRNVEREQGRSSR